LRRRVHIGWADKETIMKRFILAVALAMPALTYVHAQDRLPSADERARIEAALRKEGYTSWGKIELDDGRVWEVDNARDAEDREWDLQLDTGSLAITKKDD